MKGVKEYIASNLPLMDTINKIAFSCLGITTAWTANAVAADKLRGVMPSHEIISAIIAVCIAGIIAVIFDFGLRKNFISALLMFNADDFKTAKPSIKLIVIGFAVIAMFRLGLSSGATFISSIFISDDLVHDQSTDQLEKMLSDKEKTKQDITLSLASQIKDIRGDADKRANTILNAAIERGGKKWAKLWRSGNGWIRTVKGGKYGDVEKWRKGIYLAEKEADAIKEKASEQIAELQTSQTGLIKAETQDESFAAITQIKAKQLQKAESKESVLKFSLWGLDLIFVFISFFTSFGLAFGIQCHEGYEIFKNETGLLDVSREGMNASKRIALSYMVAAVAMLDRKAYRVANSLSNGEGYLELNAETLQMRRKSPDTLPVGSSVDLQALRANQIEWRVADSADSGMPTSANRIVPTSVDSADKTQKKKNPNRIGHTVVDNKRSVDTKPENPVGDRADSEKGVRVGNNADTFADSANNEDADNADSDAIDMIIRTVMIDGVPHVKHKKANGEVVKWTVRDVNKSMSTYMRRMKQAKKDGKKSTYETNKRNVQLMTKYLIELSKTK